MHLRRLRDIGGNPSAAMLARIAAVYDCDIRELFVFDQDPAGAR